MLLAFGISIDMAAEDGKKRPEKWAEPIKLAGVPNLHKVSSQLCRCAQPTKEGFKNLEKMGIKTVVNLRSFHSDRKKVKDTNMEYIHIYMKAWHPEKKEIIKFLKTVTDPAKTPVLVHCQHGADRTGTMCAVYRIAVQGWSKEDALEEMRQGDYNFHEIWKNLVPWIKKLDVEAIKKEAGIK
jgi:protein tyrosine/serine phosphatase